MKKIIIPLLFLLASCVNDTISTPNDDYDTLKILKPSIKPEYPKSIQSPDLSTNIYDYEPWVVIIQDSCEYIYTTTSRRIGGPIFTHKGNCKFCEKRLEKRFEELYNRLKNK